MKSSIIKSFLLKKELWLQIIIWLLYFGSINVNWTSSWVKESFLPDNVAPHIALIVPIIFLLNVYWLIPKFLNKKEWFKYLWLCLSLVIGFVIVRALVFVLLLPNSNSFTEVFKAELFGENSIIFGFLNVLIFYTIFYSFVYRFTRDWLINISIIERLKSEKNQLQLNTLQLVGHSDFNTINLETVEDNNSEIKSIKKTFTAKKRDGMLVLKVDEILFFQAQGDFVFAYDNNANKHIINESLKAVREQICESQFFQINRSELINFNYINKFKSYTKNRLEISLHNSTDRLYTSNSRTPKFRLWIEQH